MNAKYLSYSNILAAILEKVGVSWSVPTIIGVGMILKLGGLNHGEHVRSGTLSIISHFKDYVHK